MRRGAVVGSWAAIVLLAIPAWGIWLLACLIVGGGGGGPVSMLLPDNLDWLGVFAAAGWVGLATAKLAIAVHPSARMRTLLVAAPGGLLVALAPILLRIPAGIHADRVRTFQMQQAESSEINNFFYVYFQDIFTGRGEDAWALFAPERQAEFPLTVYLAHWGHILLHTGLLKGVSVASPTTDPIDRTHHRTLSVQVEADRDSIQVSYDVGRGLDGRLRIFGARGQDRFTFPTTTPGPW